LTRIARSFAYLCINIIEEEVSEISEILEKKYFGSPPRKYCAKKPDPFLEPFLKNNSFFHFKIKSRCPTIHMWAGCPLAMIQRMFRKKEG